MNRILSPLPMIICLIIISAFLNSCTRTEQPVESKTETNINTTAQSEPEADPNIIDLGDADASIVDNVRNERWTGDIAGMLQRRYIRALVIYNKTTFFYDGPRTRGISYDSLVEFEKFLNKKLDTGKEPIHIIFIPVTREEAFKRMQSGRGDIAVGNIPILADLENIADFSDPVRENAKQLVVAGPSAPAIQIVDDLSGKEVYVRKMSRYWLTLEHLNEKLKKDGKPPVVIREADSNLEDEDIINMVAAGQIPMTMTDDLTAGLWVKVFPELKVYDQIPLVTDDRIAWAVQNGAKNFLGLVNEFVKDHKIGTTFGNMMLANYFQNTKFAKNNTTPAEMEKYKAAAAFFKKYGEQQGYDWRLIAAQAYQESQIDQSVRSPAGAVGVMQIKPTTAADDPINITGVDTNMENNIRAGVKYLDYISKRYFADAKMTPLDRALFAFASYNAGPAKIAKLRKKAEDEGLDPNKWFGNVELVAAHDIGAETVTYVSNIYKYYVAYKMGSETNAVRRKAAG